MRRGHEIKPATFFIHAGDSDHVVGARCDELHALSVAGDQISVAPTVALAQPQKFLAIVEPVNFVHHVDPGRVLIAENLADLAGGGIGKQVALGDVVIAAQVKFDCTTQFKTQSWARASFPTAPLPGGAIAAISPDLTRVNAARVVGGRKIPKIWSGGQTAIVTTDFFGFDDSTNFYKLQGLGQACDMGDAMVADALQGSSDLRFYAIRNASDPQIPDPSGNIKAAKQTAGEIYMKYGAFTTAASAIASWAVIDTAINKGSTNKNPTKRSPVRKKTTKR